MNEQQDQQERLLRLEERLAELENTQGRLQRLEDLEAIRELLVQYAKRFDAAKYHAWSELFSEDGEWYGPTFEGAGGPAAIYDMIASTGRFPDDKPRFEEYHLIGNPAITLEGDRAHATSLGVVVRKGPDGIHIPMIAYYVDDLVRGPDGTWLFEVRRDFHTPPYLAEKQIGPAVGWSIV